MQPRIKNPALLFPDALNQLLALNKVIDSGGAPKRTLNLVYLRASQINGCSFCVDMHSRDLKQGGASDDFIWAVGAWRESPHFNDAERAALALAEAATRIADSADPVPDAVWDEAARHYDERALGALVLGVGAINLFNRVNVATRQMADARRAKQASAAA